MPTARLRQVHACKRGSKFGFERAPCVLLLQAASLPPTVLGASWQRLATSLQPRRCSCRCVCCEHCVRV